MSAASAQAALAEIESRRLVPVEVNEKRRVEFHLGGISSRRLGDAYTQMADLLRAGVPLLRGLKLLGGSKGNPQLAQCFRELAEAVERGSDLGAAMSEKPSVFPPVHVAMVRAGEKGGFLDDVLRRLGVMVIRQAELRSKLIGNMIYPALLAVMGTVIFIVIFTVFVPKFRPMFAKLGDDLPGATKFVFAVSDAFGRYGLVTACVLAALVAGAIVAVRRPRVREQFELLKVRLPVVGPILKNMATARLCSLLGTMLGNGVPMLSALSIAKEGTGNDLMKEAVGRAAEAVRSGQPLSAPLEQSGLLDDDVLVMIQVAETSNNLDEVLTTVADTIEQRLDRLVLVGVRLVEPILLVGLASVVGIVAAALLLPLSKLSGAV